MQSILLAVLMVGTALGAGLRPASAQSPAPRQVQEQDVYAIAAQLRCVVCQNLSVGDSPSEMANQMRVVIRERLAAGESREQVIQYFVDKYGDWILLAPPRRGFTLLVWIFPYIAVGIGLIIVGYFLRTWTRRSSVAPPKVVVDPTMSERIRREMESER